MNIYIRILKMQKKSEKENKQEYLSYWFYVFQIYRNSIFLILFWYFLIYILPPAFTDILWSTGFLIRFPKCLYQSLELWPMKQHGLKKKVLSEHVVIWRSSLIIDFKYSLPIPLLTPCRQQFWQTQKVNFIYSFIYLFIYLYCCRFIL